MGFNIIWDDPQKTILRIAYTEDLTIEEARQVKLQREILLQGASHPVDIVVDLTSIANVSPKLTGFMKLSGVGGNHPNYSGLTVIIGDPTLVEQIREQFPIVDLSGEVVVVRSLREAHERIEFDRLNRTNPF